MQRSLPKKKIMATHQRQKAIKTGKTTGSRKGKITVEVDTSVYLQRRKRRRMEGLRRKQGGKEKGREKRDDVNEENRVPKSKTQQEVALRLYMTERKNKEEGKCTGDPTIMSASGDAKGQESEIKRLSTKGPLPPPRAPHPVSPSVRSNYKKERKKKREREGDHIVFSV